MRLKVGVKLVDLCPQMVLALLIVEGCYHRQIPDYEVWVTSCNDSKHMDGSLHYIGKAADTRTKDFTGDKHQLLTDCREALGANFDVLLEGEGTDNEHLHVEYDPKGV